MVRRAYPSDVSDREQEIIEPLLPIAYKQSLKLWLMPSYGRIWLWSIGACGLVALIYRHITQIIN